MSNGAVYALLAPLSPAAGGLIWADQNGPRPAKPYATVSVRTIDPFRPASAPVDAEGVSRVTQMRALSVEWQFIGMNASDLASTAALWLRTETHADRAKVLGLGISSVEIINEVPTILNATQTEQRAIAELIIYDSEYVDDSVGIISDVELDCSDIKLPSVEE